MQMMSLLRVSSVIIMNNNLFSCGWIDIYIKVESIAIN